MIALLLWLLATLDAGFTGYREAAGRSGLIDKRRYYLVAMLRGALFGQIAIAVAAGIILVMLSMAPHAQTLLSDFERAGSRMLVIYVPYAAIILIAFIFRLIPSVDIRSITSTLIFGPFTLIRPLVAVAGLVYGILAAPRVAVVALGVIVLAMMLSFEKALGLVRRFGQDQQPAQV
jgi:hypothetical protein